MQHSKRKQIIHNEKKHHSNKLVWIGRCPITTLAKVNFSIYHSQCLLAALLHHLAKRFQRLPCSRSALLYLIIFFIYLIAAAAVAVSVATAIAHHVCIFNCRRSLFRSNFNGFLIYSMRNRKWYWMLGNCLNYIDIFEKTIVAIKTHWHWRQEKCIFIWKLVCANITNSNLKWKIEIVYAVKEGIWKCPAKQSVKKLLTFCLCASFSYFVFGYSKKALIRHYVFESFMVVFVVVV